MIEKIWRWWVRRECWKCATRIIVLGQDNGEAQEHLNAAKDALYRAARAMET